MITGRRVVGTQPVKVDLPGDPSIRSVLFASPLNSVPVFLGPTGSVTADAADVTDGFPVYPGKTFAVVQQVPRIAAVWLVAAAEGQKVWFAYQ
jgi:hypothetical protein